MSSTFILKQRIFFFVSDFKKLYNYNTAFLLKIPQLKDGSLKEFSKNIKHILTISVRKTLEK